MVSADPKRKVANTDWVGDRPRPPKRARMAVKEDGGPLEEDGGSGCVRDGQRPLQDILFPK